MVLEVLDNEEALIEKIVAKTEMTRKQLSDKIKKKQEEYGGLLTTAGAAYSVAKDLSVDLELKEEEVKLTPLNALDPALGRASIAGTVKRVFPAKEWAKGTKKGKVASLILEDSTGETRVSFWNDDCEKIAAVGIGDRVEIQNAVTRKREDAVELSFGRASQLVTKEKAEPRERTVGINGIKDGMECDCFARVVRVFPAKKFARKDGSEGTVANIVISDGTETRLVLWDGQAALASTLQPGDTVKIEDAYVRDNNGRLELNLGRKGTLSKNPVNAPDMAVDTVRSERKSISELREGDTYKEVKAVLVRAFPPTVFSLCPKCGKTGGCGCGIEAKKALIVNSELDDGTGIIRGVFFRNMAEQLLGLNADQFAENGYDTNKILGIEKIFQGQVKKNPRFERDEFIVRAVRDVDLDAEIKALE